MAISAPKSYDTKLEELLQDIDRGKLQLPEFQRDWTWDDDRIRNIIASLTQGYPMGALMQLECGGEVRLKYRTFEGAPTDVGDPRYLVLDGQQRLTSLYRSLYSQKPVHTKNAQNKSLDRYYYFDIRKCMDSDEDRADAIVSIDANSRKITENIGRDVVLDLSGATEEERHEREIEQLMFPANLVFDGRKQRAWSKQYSKRYGFDTEEDELWDAFETDVLDTITEYKLPVITLDKETPREAVCRVFENVNTGGVSLTVFELVTASFATYEFDLRNDWEQNVKPRIHGGEDGSIVTDLMDGLDATAFLTSMTLLSTYKAKRAGKGATRCKKKDVLSLEYEDYCENKEALIGGFESARQFLLNEGIYRMRDLPYTTQLIPLAAICAYVGPDVAKKPPVRNILRQWFWCGVFGEMYGGANETRYANDIEDVVDEIEGRESQKRTVNAAFFQPTRLLGLQTRNSAAYKGVMALIFQAGAKDFITGEKMDQVKAMNTPPDIHHIFPKAYCERKGLDSRKWNSVVNKTPLINWTNRVIGGYAPSTYLVRVRREGDNLSDEELRANIESHCIDYDLLAADDFDGFFVDRAKRLLDLIDKAMGKQVSGRSSEETIKAFGASLEWEEEQVVEEPQVVEPSEYAQVEDVPSEDERAEDVQPIVEQLTLDVLDEQTETNPLTSAWDEVMDYFVDAARPFAERLARIGAPAPDLDDVGFQLEDGPMAEIAWPDCRCCYLTPDQLDNAPAFQAAGWRVISEDAADEELLTILKE